MRTKIIIAAVALLAAMPAMADFKFITQGYEVALSDVRLPRNIGGTIAFKPCAECSFETRRVTADVRWEINGQALSLAEFRKRTAQLGDRETRPVTVTRHIESDRITKVSAIVRDGE